MLESENKTMLNVFDKPNCLFQSWIVLNCVFSLCLSSLTLALPVCKWLSFYLCMRDSPKCSDTIHPDLGQPFDAIIVWRGSHINNAYIFSLVYSTIVSCRIWSMLRQTHPFVSHWASFTRVSTAQWIIVLAASCRDDLCRVNVYHLQYCRCLSLADNDSFIYLVYCYCIV